jgi:large subunit ribosomal protein L19
MAIAGKHTSPINVEKRALLDIKPGDTVRVWQKIKEGDKTRLQAFEGLIIAKKHGKEAGATFTVRKVASGVGVEKIFPLYSPLIDKIEILKRSRVRRAKLYFIREKASREIKKKMRQIRFLGTPVDESIAPESSVEEKSEEGNTIEAPKE